jgi:hypothetical protein
VFRAYDPDHDRLVAVKLFRLELPPERAHQLVSELERLIAAAPVHSAIVLPIAAGLDGVCAYLAGEYVAAESLDLVLRQSGPLAPASVVGIAAQLSGALDFAASVNMDHGVLHPRDVLLAGGEVKLTGLGIARALERVGVPTPVRRPYTAPERLTGSAWDRRADVYGLAALVHEMLWGRRVTAAGEAAAEALTELPGGDLVRLRALFGRALAEDPAERFDTALEFAGGLAVAFPEATRLCPPAEPRLPLDTFVDTSAVDMPAPAAAAAAPGRFDAGGELDVYQPEPAMADIALTDASDPEILPMPAPDPVIRREAPRPPQPSSSIDSYQAAAAGSIAEDRSRSAISPLAFALLIGAALGFAAGFGVGSRDRSAAVATLESQAPVPDTHEFSEGAVAPPVASSGTTVRPQPDGGGSRAAEPAPVNGSVLVRSAPVGATVLVDGRDFGRTPVTVRGLARGAHRVEVTRDGYTAEARQIAITSSQPAHSMTVRLSPARAVPPALAVPAPVPLAPAAAAKAAVPTAAPLTVESRPAGAKVFIDGRFAGVTPLVVPEVAAGDHSITFDLDGYRRWTSPVRITPSAENRVTASLDR